MRRLYYSDDDFGQAFRDALGDYREVPPSGNWKRLRARLDKRKYRRYTGWISAAAALLAVVTLGIGINLSTKNARLRNEALKEHSLIQQENARTAKSNSVSTNPVAADVAADKPTVFESSGSQAPALSHQSISTVAKNRGASKQNTVGTKKSNSITANTAQVSSTDNNLIPGFENETLAPINTLESPAFETYADRTIRSAALPDEAFVGNSVLAMKAPAPSCYKFYVGVAAQPQHNTFYSESALHDRRMRYKFSPGYAFGLTAGYNVCSKLSIETGALWSVENQVYDFSNQPSKKPLVSVPNSTQTKVSLAYIRVPLIVKYKMRWAADQTVCDNSINLLGGVQYGRFLTGSTKAHLEYSLTSEELKKNDVQVIVGVERTQSLAPSLSFNYGFRAGYGLGHMASGHSQRVNTMYKPHNMLAAVHLSLTLHK
ncbi:MAG TPA: outer membrane beta-barrel protein [Chitinophagales bacterium]|nr:outer membrane beta-barrel protein [Chitinophagales bacterium]